MKHLIIALLFLGFSSIVIKADPGIHLNTNSYCGLCSGSCFVPRPRPFCLRRVRVDFGFLRSIQTREFDARYKTGESIGVSGIIRPFSHTLVETSLDYSRLGFLSESSNYRTRYNQNYIRLGVAPGIQCGHKLLYQIQFMPFISYLLTSRIIMENIMTGERNTYKLGFTNTHRFQWGLGASAGVVYKNGPLHLNYFARFQYFQSFTPIYYSTDPNFPLTQKNRNRVFQLSFGAEFKSFKRHTSGNMER